MMVIPERDGVLPPLGTATIRLRVAVLGLVAAVALTIAATAGAAGGLTGTVGPGFTITLDRGGKAVRKLKPGEYTVRISDKSSIHDFHLRGPGVNKRTSVAGTGSTRWKVTLKKGTYTYVCDVHSSTMHGSFIVS